jgi:hypothetical protein
MNTHNKKFIHSVITMGAVALLITPQLSLAEPTYPCNVPRITDACGLKLNITCSVEVLHPSYGTECAPADPESIMTGWTICTAKTVPVYDETATYTILPEGGCDWNTQLSYVYWPNGTTCDIVVMSGERCPPIPE